MIKFRSFRRHLWAVPFELVMLGGVVVTFGQGNWKHFAVSLFTLGVSFLPLLVERWFRIKMPSLLQAVYVAFIFASMFAGEVLGMYGRVWPWDDAMHIISGLLVGLVVVLWLALFAHRHKQFRTPVWFQSLTVFCVVVTMAVLWEIAEFASDQLFGTFSQGGDLYDTMLDITYGAASGTVMAIVWVSHLKYKNFFLVSHLVARFERLNTPDKGKS